MSWNRHAGIRVAVVVFLLAATGLGFYTPDAAAQACDRSFYGPEKSIFEKSNTDELHLEWVSVAEIRAKTILGDRVGRVCAAYSKEDLKELFGFKVAFGGLEYLVPLDVISRGGKLYEIGDSPTSEIPGQFSEQGSNHLYSISVGLLAKENFVAETSPSLGEISGGGLSEYNAYVLRVGITDKASIRFGSEDKKPSQYILTLVNEWNRIEGRRNIFLVSSPEALAKRMRIQEITFHTTSPQVTWVQKGVQEIVRYKLVEEHRPAYQRRGGFFRRLIGRVPSFTSYSYQPFRELEPVYEKVQDLEGVRSVIGFKMSGLQKEQKNQDGQED